MPLNQSGQQVPFPPVPNVLKLQMKYATGQDLDIIVNLHFKYSGAVTSSVDLNSFLTQVAAAHTTYLTPLVSTVNTHSQDTATDIASSSGLQAVHTPGQAGTRVGPALPINVAALFVGKVARRYRGGKPRNYWPFGSGSDTANPGQWATAAVSAFNSGMSGFINSISVNYTSFTVTGQVNVSYYQGHFAVQNGVTKRWRNVPTLGPSPPYPYVDALSSYSCDTVYGSQRRRLHPG